MDQLSPGAFSLMDEVPGPVTGRHMQLLMVLEMASAKCLLPRIPDHMPGRPLKQRAALARAFIGLKCVPYCDDKGIAFAGALGPEASASVWVGAAERCTE